VWWRRHEAEGQRQKCGNAAAAASGSVQAGTAPNREGQVVVTRGRWWARNVGVVQQAEGRKKRGALGRAQLQQTQNRVWLVEAGVPGSARVGSGVKYAVPGVAYVPARRLYGTYAARM